MSNEMIKREENSFLKLKDFNINTLMSEELEGLNLSFEKIKIPAAGNITYEIPGLNEDEPDNVKEFKGVILHHHPVKLYYKEKFTGGSNPPQCGSFDGIEGAGIPGGLCKSCQLNKFESGENKGKACKDKRRLYVFYEGEIFPYILSLPTGSLKDFSRYIKMLLSKGKKSNMVVTKFSLKKAVNMGGISYSKAQFMVDRDLTKEEFEVIENVSNQIKEYSKDEILETARDSNPFDLKEVQEDEV